MNPGAGTDVIHIACQADHRFAPDCGVMLHSLLSVNAGERFEIHFLHHPDFAAEDAAGLSEIAERFGARWSPQPVTDAMMTGFPFSPHFGGYAACYRLLLPQLLPGVDRVLYLDADTLHVDRIRSLWEIGLDEYCVAAVTNPLFADMRPRVEDSLGVPADSYFNSGVLLFNLERMRRTGLADQLVSFARKRPVPLPWPDQDALNAVLWRQRLALHPRWNTLTGIYELASHYMPWSEQILEEARTSPAVLHFVGGYKPRHYRFQHVYRERYFEHLQQTHWRDLPIEGRSLGHWLMRQLPALCQWRVEAALKWLGRLPARMRRRLTTAAKI